MGQLRSQFLAVPSLEGQIRAAPGFQLFFTQSEQVGSVREELTKLVRRVTVTSLRQEEMKRMIRTRFPKLEDLTEDNENVLHNHQPQGPHRLP